MKNTIIALCVLAISVLGSCSKQNATRAGFKNTVTHDLNEDSLLGNYNCTKHYIQYYANPYLSTKDSIIGPAVLVVSKIDASTLMINGDVYYYDSTDSQQIIYQAYTNNSLPYPVHFVLRNDSIYCVNEFFHLAYTSYGYYYTGHKQ